MKNNSFRFVTHFPISTKEIRLIEGNDEQEYDGSGIIFYLIVYLCIVAVIGVIANVLVMVKTVLFERNIRRRRRDLTMTSTNYFVLSLALSNMGTLTISLMFYIWVYYISFPITEFLCRYILPIRELFVAVSIFSITFIGVDRYLILFKGFREKMVALSYKVWVAMLWLLCYLIVALPFSFVYKVVNVDGAYVCDSAWKTSTGRRAHLTFLLIFNILMPGVVVFLCYSGIIRSLKKVRSFAEPTMPGNLNRSAALIITKSKRTVTVSLMMVIAFWITYVPCALLNLYIEYSNPHSSSIKPLEILQAIAAGLVYSSGMVFPLILLFSVKSRKLRTTVPLSRSNDKNVNMSERMSYLQLQLQRIQRE